MQVTGNLIRDCKDRRDQDGRVGGCGAHLPTTDTSKIYLHVEQFSRKTGNWPKNSYTTKAVRRISM